MAAVAVDLTPMRYPLGRGLTAERRVFCEGVRLVAADMFAGGLANAVVAKRLPVSAFGPTLAPFMAGRRRGSPVIQGFGGPSQA